MFYDIDSRDVTTSSAAAPPCDEPSDNVIKLFLLRHQRSGKISWSVCVKSNIWGWGEPTQRREHLEGWASTLLTNFRLGEGRHRKTLQLI